MNTQFRREIKLLLQAGLLIFSFTVVVGILNGLDAMEFARPMLMAHVHAGTLGWITLGFIAACLWIFCEGRTVSGWRASAPRWLGVVAILSILFYAWPEAASPWRPSWASTPGSRRCCGARP